MEDVRPSKLRRLEDLRRSNPYVSSSALSNIVKDIHNHGLPELHQPEHMKQARDSRLAECRAYGPVIDHAPIMHKDGTERKLLLINMFSLMQGLFEQDGAFTALVKTSLHKFPSTHSTPWSLICIYEISALKQLSFIKPCGYSTLPCVCHVGHAHVMSMHSSSKCALSSHVATDQGMVCLHFMAAILDLSKPCLQHASSLD